MQNAERSWRSTAARIAALDAGVEQPDREAALIQGLQDESRVVRERAIALAAQCLEPETLGRFVENDENAVLRNAAIEALTRQGAYAAPFLRRVLDGPNPEAAMFAVQILGRIGDAPAVPHLLRLLGHPDENVCLSAVEALGDLGAREAVPHLLRLLDRGLWWQLAAMRALAAIGDPRAARPILELANEESLGEAAVEALGALGAAESLAPLAELLLRRDDLPFRDKALAASAAVLSRHPEPWRLGAMLAEAGGETGAAGLRAYLEASLREGEPPLAGAAMAVVVAGGLRELDPALFRRRDDPSWDERLLTALRLLEPAQRDRFVPLLAHPEGAVREGVIRLALFGGDPVPLLLRRLEDADPAVRKAACLACGRLAAVAVVPRLIARLREAAEEERAAAAEALACMPAASLAALAPLLEPGAGREAHLAALGVLELCRGHALGAQVQGLLRIGERALRLAALRALKRAEDRGADDAVLPCLEDTDEEIRTEAVEVIVHRGIREAVPILLGLLQRPDLVRYHVIRALGRLGDPAAAGPLRDLFPAAGPHERLALVAALTQIAPPWIVAFLKRRLHEEDQEVRRLAAQGLVRTLRQDDPGLLVALAQDADWNLRNVAAWGLGELGWEEGRPTLLRLLRDLEPVVARTAAAALQKLGPATDPS